MAFRLNMGIAMVVSSINGGPSCARLAVIGTSALVLSLRVTDELLDVDDEEQVVDRAVAGKDVRVGIAVRSDRRRRRIVRIGVF